MGEGSAENKCFDAFQEWNGARKRRDACLRLLSQLHPKRRHCRDAVLTVGRAMRAVDYRLREAWVQWAKPSGVASAGTLRSAWHEFRPRTNADDDVRSASCRPSRELLFLTQGSSRVEVPFMLYTPGDAGDQGGKRGRVAAGIRGGDVLLMPLQHKGSSDRRVSQWVRVCTISIHEECIILCAPLPEAGVPVQAQEAAGLAKNMFEVFPSHLPGSLVLRSQDGDQPPIMFRLPEFSASWGMQALTQMAKEDEWWVSGPGAAASQLEKVALREVQRRTRVHEWKRVKDRKARARSLLGAHLHRDRASLKDTWLEVGKCLFSLGEEMLLDWIAWTAGPQQSAHGRKLSLSTSSAPTFSEDDCRRAWSSFRPRTSLDDPAVLQFREDSQGEVDPFAATVHRPHIPAGSLMVSLDDAGFRKRVENDVESAPHSSSMLHFLGNGDRIRTIELPAARLLHIIPAGRMPAGLLLGDDFACSQDKGVAFEPGAVKGILRSSDMVLLSRGPLQRQGRWLRVLGIDVARTAIIVCDVWERAYGRQDRDWLLPWGGRGTKNSNGVKMQSLPPASSRLRRWRVGLQDLWGAWIFRETLDASDGIMFDDQLEKMAGSSAGALVFQLPTPDARGGIRRLENMADADSASKLPTRPFRESHRQIRLLDRTANRLVVGWGGAGEASLEVLVGETWTLMYQGPASGCEIEGLRPCTLYRIRVWMSPEGKDDHHVGGGRLSSKPKHAAFSTLPSQPRPPLVWLWSTGGCLPPDRVLRLKLSSPPPGSRWEVEFRRRPLLPPPLLLYYRKGKPEFLPMSGRDEAAVKEWAAKQAEESTPQSEQVRAEIQGKWTVAYRGAQKECFIRGLFPGVSYEFRSCLVIEDGTRGPWSDVVAARAPRLMRKSTADAIREAPAPAPARVPRAAEASNPQQDAVSNQNQRAELLLSFAKLMEEYGSCGRDVFCDGDNGEVSGSDAEDSDSYEDEEPRLSPSRPSWTVMFDATESAYYRDSETGLAQWSAPETWQIG